MRSHCAGRSSCRPPTGARPVEDVLAGLAGLDRALACPSLADQAPALRRGATTLVAEGLVELWRTDDAIRVLEGPCAAGDPVLCAHRDRLRAAVVPQLPRVTTSCEGVYPEHFVAVSAAGIALDGVRMTDSSALRTAVADLTRDSEFPVKIGLAFDQRMTLAELAPIFAAVQAPARPPLSILVLAGEAATLRQLAIEPSTQDPGQPDDLDTYLARVDGEQTTLSRMRSPKVPVPAGTELGDARLLVTARRDSPWRVVAAAVARGCGDVRLIDRAAPPRRAP